MTVSAAARARAHHSVVAAVDAAIAAGEIGVQVAAYLGDELVIDVSAGLADEITGRRVAPDTLFPVFHVTKAAAIMAVQLQAERGLIDLDAPVCRYWPEFAAHGKERGTVRDGLVQRLGVPQMPDGCTVERMCDWDWMVEHIAALEPMFAPGTTSAYHGYTIGWILGELVQRTDPERRSFARFVHDEICVPLHIADLWIGISDEAEPRIARLTSFPPGTPPPGAPIFRTMPEHLFVCREVFGRPDVRRACIPGAGGNWNARSGARLFSILAGRGVAGGVRFLSEERVRSFAEPRPGSADHDVMVDHAMWLGTGGFHLGGPDADAIINLPRELYHSGGGGSIAWADPELGYSAAICHNRMFMVPAEQNPFVRVGQAVRDAIALLR